MSSYTKTIGDIGTSVVVSEFLKHGISVLLPYDDNSPYDIVINVDNNFYKIQVKTTEKILFGEVMKFSTNISNPNKKTTRVYTKEEVDFFALYCVENDWVGLMKYTNEQKEISIRITDVKNNQQSKSKFASEYKIHDQILNYFNKDYLKKYIVHNEKKSIRKRKQNTQLCPICGVSYIKKSSTMCRECYRKSRKKHI